MKIKDFLYKLHKADSLSNEELKEIRDNIKRQPFLSALDIHKQFANSPFNTQEENITSLAQSEYLSNLNSESILLPHVQAESSRFSVPETENSLFLPELPVVKAKNSVTGVVEQLPKPKKSLFKFEDSSYLNFLSNLPPCNPPHVKYEVLKEEKNGVLPSDQVETNKIIQESVELNQSVASESLAVLWEAQGKPELAILLYEKLALSNPEKSTTFAAKIEKLKSDNSL
ncbi:MAG: hypothetical protein ABI844_03175 [Saprospiraceae bacterium]